MGEITTPRLDGAALIPQKSKSYWKNSLIAVETPEQIPEAHLLLGLPILHLQIFAEQRTRSWVPACSAPF